MNFDNLDYTKMCSVLRNIIEKYPYCSLFSLGKSQMERELYCIRMGKGKRKIFLNGAHHSLEWITSSLLCSFALEYAKCLKSEKKFFGYDILNLYEKSTYYILPMVNPDGVDIVINGISKTHAYYKMITGITHARKIKKMWQANINGVDLNHNYDANFFLGKALGEKDGITAPSCTRYSGEYPFCEPETKCIKNFCEREKFDICLALHSQGEEIYWNFGENNLFYDKAKRLSDVSGYVLKDAGGIVSCSGFKDWIIDKFNTPAFTVEVGKGKNPLPFHQFDAIKEKVFPLICELSYI